METSAQTQALDASVVTPVASVRSASLQLRTCQVTCSIYFREVIRSCW